MSKDDKHTDQPDELVEQLRAHQAGEDGAPAFSWMDGGAHGESESGGESETDGAEPDAGSDGEPEPVTASEPGGADSGGAAGAGAAVDQVTPVDQATPAAPATPAGQSEPEAETEEQAAARRRAERRAQAAEMPPIMPGIWQLIVAICFPVVLLIALIRLVATPLFSWVEYFRPGFPADSFGFGAQDRLNYGSYVVDFLNNLAGPQYLSGLEASNGVKLFKTSEVSHMSDVKLVYAVALLVGLALLIVGIIGIIYLVKKSIGGVRRAFFAGSIITLVLIIGFGVLALTGFETFFTDFHQVFFSGGNWQFALSDTLIRLYPEQFWIDAAAMIAVVAVVVAGLVFAFTWPTKRRRQLAREARTRPVAAQARLD